MPHDSLPVSIKGVILKGDGEITEVLLLRSYNNGLWDLPGGRQDSGEKAEDAVVREIMEETSLTVGGGERVHTGIITIFPPWILFEKHVRIEVYGFHLNDEMAQSEVTTSHEHLEARWVRVNEIPGMLYVPDIYKDAILSWHAKKNSFPLEDACIMQDDAGISEQDISKFLNLGFLIVKSAISSLRAGDLRAQVENEFAKPGNQIKTFLEMPVDGPVRSHELMRNPRIISPLKSIFNGEIAFSSLRAVRGTPGNGASPIDKSGNLGHDVGVVYALGNSRITDGGFYATPTLRERAGINADRLSTSTLPRRKSKMVMVDAGDAIVYDKSARHVFLPPMEGRTRLEIRLG